MAGAYRGGGAKISPSAVALLYIAHYNASDSRVFRFDPKNINGKFQIPLRLICVVILDVGFLGNKKKFRLS